MHSKTDNIEITINDRADEVTEDVMEKLFQSLSFFNFTFDCVNLLHYKCLL